MQFPQEKSEPQLLYVALTALVFFKKTIKIANRHAKRAEKKVLLGIRTHVCGFQTQGTKPLGHQNCKWPPI